MFVRRNGWTRLPLPTIKTPLFRNAHNFLAERVVEFGQLEMIETELDDGNVGVGKHPTQDRPRATIESLRVIQANVHLRRSLLRQLGERG